MVRSPAAPTTVGERIVPVAMAWSDLLIGNQ